MTQFPSTLTNKSYDVNINDYLLSFLSPTAPGTNYWDSPTKANLVALTDREISRIASQVSEILEIIPLFPLLYNNQSSFLDVGTGNGMVPRLLSRILIDTNILGIDPFLHGGHETSWQNSDLDQEIINCVNYINSSFQLQHSASLNSTRNYEENRLFLHEYIARNPNKKFTYVYCKAIEHVPDWRPFAHDLSSVVERGGLLIIKHRSFYSYLGPHRYATTGIPWGHCLLNDIDYRNYTLNFHQNRHQDMNNFYFSSLSYPRMTNNELFNELTNCGFDLVLLKTTKPKYNKQQDMLLPKYTSYIHDALSHNPSLTLDEMLSGTYTFVFRRKS